MKLLHQQYSCLWNQRVIIMYIYKQNKLFELCCLTVQNTVFHLFCVCRFICFKELRNFASEICQQKLLSSKGTCPMGFVFLSLSLTRSSPLSVVTFIQVCPHTGQILFPTVPLLDPLFLQAPTSPCLVTLQPWSITCAFIASFYIFYFPWLLSCLHLNHTFSSPSPVNMVTEYTEK